MKNTRIEWADHTFNPWEGCTKVSPGCANCYAENRNARFGGGMAPNWGKGAPRRRTSADNWKQPLKWDREASEKAQLFSGMPWFRHPAQPRPRVFCASLADWLDDEVPVEWLADLLDLIRRTPNLDWLLLTKRPQDWRLRLDSVLGYVEMLPEEDPRHALSGWGFDWYDGKPPANVWVGTSVEDQARADERIPLLLQIPAKVRFLSMEPLLGHVDLWYPESVYPGGPSYCCSGIDCGCGGRPIDPPMLYGINWIIVGGESGPKARPMHPQWVQSIRDQCKSSGIPFHFKQWGEWAPGRGEDRYSETKPLRCMKPDGTFSWWAGDDDTTYNHSENYEDHDIAIERVGKSSAGRLLDGVEHNGFPGGAS